MRGPALGSSRCRLHGGAPGSGAPEGERNGRFRDGARSKAAVRDRRWARSLVQELAGNTMTMCGKELIVSGHKELADKPKRQPIVVKVRQVEGVKRIAVAPDDDVAGWRNKLKVILATSSPLFVEARPCGRICD